jgi:hypothetical protein
MPMLYRRYMSTFHTCILCSHACLNRNIVCSHFCKPVKSQSAMCGQLQRVQDDSILINTNNFIPHLSLIMKKQPFTPTSSM